MALRPSTCRSSSIRTSIAARRTCLASPRLASGWITTTPPTTKTMRTRSSTRCGRLERQSAQTVGAPSYGSPSRSSASTIRLNVCGVSTRSVGGPISTKKTTGLLSAVPERGWSSRFGELRGIEGVQPRQRLEVLPYVAASSSINSDRDLDNPFESAANLSGRVGTDVKIGIGSNFTLDATFNPDFGQIEADPAEVNLSVFESTFSERRPFFIEGNSVLAAGTGNFYYSRRIGARPNGSASGDYVDYPDTSTILGAAKLTGRLQSGTSMGFLGAVTSAESARLVTDDVQSKVTVAPLATWGVARMIQELGTGGSTFGAHVTMVHRDLDETDPLAATLTRNAITTGFDTRLRFMDRIYEAALSAGFTYVDGEPVAMERVQRANGHFFQRPDQPDIRLDPTRTTLGGTQVVGSFNKVGGRHWLWGVSLMIESPEFHPLDFGRLNYAGDFNGGPRLTYRETRPGKYLRSYSLGVSLTNNWYFDTDLGVRNNVGVNGNVTFNNFWSASLNTTTYLRGQDVQLTRGGPSMGTPQGFSMSGSLRNSSGANTRWSGDAGVRRNEFDEVSWNIGGSLSARPSPSLQFSFSPDYSNENGTNATQNGPINRQVLVDSHWRPPRNLRPAIYFRARGPDHRVVTVPGELRVQARCDARRLRRTVRGERAISWFRGTGHFARPRSPALRHGWDDHRTLAGRQLRRDRRHGDLHAAEPGLQQPIVPQQRRPSMGVAAGEHAVCRLAAESLQLTPDGRTRRPR